MIVRHGPAAARGGRRGWIAPRGRRALPAGAQSPTRVPARRAGRSPGRVRGRVPHRGLLRRRCPGAGGAPSGCAERSAIRASWGSASDGCPRIRWWAGSRAQAGSERRRGDRGSRVTRATSVPLALALSNQSQLHMLAGRRAECIAIGRRAVLMARDVGDAAVLSHALDNVGTALWDDGTPEGQAMLEESLSVALEAGEVEHACRAYVNIVWHLMDVLRFAEARLNPRRRPLELAEESRVRRFPPISPADSQHGVPGARPVGRGRARDSMGGRRRADHPLPGSRRTRHRPGSAGPERRGPVGTGLDARPATRRGTTHRARGGGSARGSVAARRHLPCRFRRGAGIRGRAPLRSPHRRQPSWDT